MKINETHSALENLTGQLDYAVRRAKGRTTITPRDIEVLHAALMIVAANRTAPDLYLTFAEYGD